MLWSLLKVGIFVVLAALLAWGAGIVLDTPGKVQIAFGGRELMLEPFDFLLALAIAFGLFWLLLKLAGLLVAVLRFFNGDETALSRYFDRNRERRGYEALSDGLLALASGDGREAIVKAARAERLLDRPDLTLLMNAQAAELAGNRQRAEEYYKKLTELDRTRFVGIWGLLRQRLEDGNAQVALRLSEKAFAIKPGHVGVLDTLFRLQTDGGDWAGARRTLEAKVKARHLPRDVGARRDAILSLATAREAEMKGDLPAARTAAYEANRLAPTLVPAAVTAARLKALEGDKKTGEKMLKKAWEANPHPDLAAALAAFEPQESASSRLKRFKPLLALKPDHPETHLLATELHLAAEDIPAARRALGDLPETRASTRTLALSAAVEKAAGADEQAVRAILARALAAPRGEAWICGKCRHVHGGWVPVCDNCDAFDTLAWDLPPAADGKDAGTEAMLPLIVGSPKPAPAPDPAPARAPAPSPSPAAADPAPASAPEPAAEKVT